jgi:hypothetical protein
VSGELLPCSANEGRFPDKFQSLEFVLNLSGICLEFVWNFLGFSNSRQLQKIPDKFKTLELVWNLSELNDLRPKSKFQTNSRVWNLSGIFCSCLEFENPRKSQTNSRQIPDKFQTLEFVWKASFVG